MVRGRSVVMVLFRQIDRVVWFLVILLLHLKVVKLRCLRRSASTPAQYEATLESVDLGAEPPSFSRDVLHDE
jgi:hypothetical protein